MEVNLLEIKNYFGNFVILNKSRLLKKFVFHGQKIVDL